MVWEEKLSDPGMGIVARYSAEMCCSEAGMRKLYGFEDGTFEYYRAQITVEDVWPIAVLHDVVVPVVTRRRGIGSEAVRAFCAAARARGAKVALLRVGWIGPLTERDWRVSWYQRLGWVILANPSEHLVVAFMYRLLGH